MTAPVYNYTEVYIYYLDKEEHVVVIVGAKLVYKYYINIYKY